MRAQAYTYKRRNYAFRVAYWSDCQRINQAPNLPAIVHGWAKEPVQELSGPARKVLSFLAALNRTGETGYCGFAVAYQLLAPHIGGATFSNFSRRSMERAIHDLKAAGLVEVNPWIREGQYFRCGGRNVRMCGAGTVELSSGAVVVRRLAIVTLTDTALAMWEAGKGKPPKSLGQKTRRNAPSAPDPSPAKMADSSPEPEQIDKSIMLGDTSDLVSSSDSLNGTRQEGRPTRPTPPRTAPPTVEHRASTPDPPSTRISQLDTGPHAALNNAHRSARESAPAPGKGCTKQQPGDGGPCPGTSATARNLILTCLWDLLANHSTRQADAIYTRASFELENINTGAVIPAVDWPYWLDLWPKLSPQDRRVKILREILPRLKNRPYHPHDQCKVVAARAAPARDPNHVAGALNPFFQGMVDRMEIKLK